MPRSRVFTAEDIKNMRAIEWQRNYGYREFAKGFGTEFSHRVLNAISRFPDPVMDVTGELDRSLSGMLFAWADHVQAACSHARLPLWETHLLAYWYWSEAGWLDYVRKFQALPDPSGKYIFSWEGRWTPVIVPKACGKVQEQVPELFQKQKEQVRNKSAVIHRGM